MTNWAWSNIEKLSCAKESLQVYSNQNNFEDLLSHIAQKYVSGLNEKQYVINISVNQ